MSKRKQIAFWIWEGIGNIAVLYMYGCIVFGYSVEAFRWVYSLRK